MAHDAEFTTKYGRWALVSGASAGIGEEYARQIAAKGLNVVIVARRKQKLESLAESLRQQHGIQVRVVVLDLSQPDFLEPLAQQTADLDIGLLVNNVGTA